MPAKIIAFPAKPKTTKRRARTGKAKRIGIKAKREAIAKVYGCPPDAGMEDYFYSRRHLAKIPADKRTGWRELKLTEEYIDLAEAMCETMRRIRQRDGIKFVNEAARFLLSEIADEIDDCAGPKAWRRAINKIERERRARL